MGWLYDALLLGTLHRDNPQSVMQFLIAEHLTILVKLIAVELILKELIMLMLASCLGVLVVHDRLKFGVLPANLLHILWMLRL